MIDYEAWRAANHPLIGTVPVGTHVIDVIGNCVKVIEHVPSRGVTWVDRTNGSLTCYASECANVKPVRPIA